MLTLILLSPACGIRVTTPFMCRQPGGKQLEAKELISLESLLLAGQKKAPKIYTLAVHPLQPHIVAVGANAGKSHQNVACCECVNIVVPSM